MTPTTIKTNIKMRVTPKQWKLIAMMIIQKEYFKYFSLYADFNYIAIDKYKCLIAMSQDAFNDSKYEEVDADLFIRTNGTCEEPLEYPRWFKCTTSELIVQFDSRQTGKVVISDDVYSKSERIREWVPHTHSDQWQEVPNPELTHRTPLGPLGLPSDMFLKADSAKPNLAILFDQPLALVEISRALEYGANKYSRKNWALCDNLERYEAAALRHMLADHNGELIDPESSLHHTAHAICSLLFKLELQLQKAQHDKTE